MWWIIGFVMGIIYVFVFFNLVAKFDNDTYDRGFTLTTAQTVAFIVSAYIWPITIFIPKLRNPEFYANLNFKRKK